MDPSVRLQPILPSWVLFSGTQFTSLLAAIQDSEQRLERKLADLRGRLRTRLQ